MDVCAAICTFRRPAVRKTLESLGQQRVPEGVKLSVRVADNDLEPAMKSQILAIAAEAGLNLTYIHAPYRNISIARNACLDNLDSDYLIFIDDDEELAEGWLVAMLSKAEKTAAQVVFGPVLAIYPENCPEWMERCDFHTTKPQYEEGVIQTGYTGNTLLDMRSEIINGERFNLSLGQTGGEDTEFFTRLFRNGAKLVYEENAIAYEEVPAHRAKLRWLIKRRYCAGQSYGHRLITGRENSSAIQSAIELTKAVIKVFICFVGLLLFSTHSLKRNFWLLRGCLHLGVTSKLIGRENLKQY
ncbi:glycosyltransferase family 2 protein [Endozoicomonas sp. SESOKO3]|uniref:glycosyltransferase n=1 Tax=Endozoicomonas sp. SESOKO3 TaxID=2828744 RepID=UPI002147BC28|nr:glycosyltransferase [Endozoicomonas sp. SESOKO3]